MDSPNTDLWWDTNDTLGIATLDTLSQMRSLAYRLPLLAGIRVPLGYNDLEIQAVEPWGGWKTSETVISQLVQGPDVERVVQAYQGRTRFITVPVMAEVGLQRRAKDGQPGWYVGWFGRVLGTGCLGGEHLGVEFRVGLGPGYLNLVVTGLDVSWFCPSSKSPK